MARRVVVAGPGELGAGEADVQRLEEELGREVADGLVVAGAAAVEDGNGRGPDDTVGAEVLTVVGAVQEELDGDKLRGDEGANGGVGIRHGIQRVAACSGVFAKVDEHEAPVGRCSLKGSGEIRFPGNSGAVHWHAPHR